MFATLSVLFHIPYLKTAAALPMRSFSSCLSGYAKMLSHDEINGVMTQPTGDLK